MKVHQLKWLSFSNRKEWQPWVESNEDNLFSYETCFEILQKFKKTHRRLEILNKKVFYESKVSKILIFFSMIIAELFQSRKLPYENILVLFLNPRKCCKSSRWEEGQLLLNHQRYSTPLAHHVWRDNDWVLLSTSLKSYSEIDLSKLSVEISTLLES